VRPMMAYFKGDLDFDGIAFSTTIHHDEKVSAVPASSTPQTAGGAKGSTSPQNAGAAQAPASAQGANSAPEADAAQGSEAVEFFFPTDALRCYEAYDCTGQQLIDQGAVLINGERVSLDLQTAEAGER